MSEPEENRETTEESEPIIAPPTANPSRVQVPPEGLDGLSDDGAEGGEIPGEEA